MRRALIGRVAAALWLIAGITIAAAHAQPPRPGPPRPIPPDMRQRMPPTPPQEGPERPAPAPWIDVHLHLIGGRGHQADYAGAAFVVSPSVRSGGPGVTFAERTTPKLQATVHFLSLLPPDVASKIGRENAMRVYKLGAR